MLINSNRVRKFACADTTCDSPIVMLQTTHAGYQRHPTIEVMKTTQVCEKGGKKKPASRILSKTFTSLAPQVGLVLAKHVLLKLLF